MNRRNSGVPLTAIVDEIKAAMADHDEALRELACSLALVKKHETAAAFLNLVQRVGLTETVAHAFACRGALLAGNPADAKVIAELREIALTDHLARLGISPSSVRDEVLA